jgi:FkbM family methyltransferase
MKAMIEDLPEEMRSQGVVQEAANFSVRLFRVIFIERRMPIRCYHYYYCFLNWLGIRVTTVRIGRRYVIKGYTKWLFMLYETWTKKVYDIPPFTLSEGMTVVDIGANQGFYTLYAAGKGAKVYAVEPCAENLEVLKWNVTQNHFEDSVKILQAAVTGSDGNVSLFVGLDGPDEIRSGTVSTCALDQRSCSFEARLVRSLTLDSLFRQEHIARCDFLKIDCEGAEYEILQTVCPETFRKIARISMETHDFRLQEAADLLDRAGFETCCENYGREGLIRAVNRSAGD